MLSTSSTKPPSKPCKGFGHGKHSPNDCKFKAATCHSCGNIGQVLQQLAKHDVHVRKDKCLLMQYSVPFLGHVVDAQGIYASSDKLAAIVEAPTP